MTEAAGIYDIAADDYHADPCERPSLSSSIAHILLTQSPAHAAAAHPKLNPARERQDAAHFDLGTAVHALFLQGVPAVEVVDAADWRTNAAKDARDAARAAGKVPLLAEQWENVQAMVAATRAQIDAVDVTPELFAAGSPERTLVWEEDGVPCRALLDWLRDDHTAIDDFKTTSRSANPEQWSRSMFSFGGDLQAAFYLRGLRAVSGVFDAEFRFVVQETFPPYALTVFAPGPDVLTLADAKIDRALAAWRAGLETDEWTAYPQRVCTVDLPPWEEARFLEREAREAA